MPLYENARELMRANLEALARGEKVPRVAIGTLTDVQLAAVNAERAAEDLPLVVAEIVFVGRHVRKGRILKDGYTIDDALDQIESALSPTAVVIATEYMTGIQSTVLRTDRLGNQVRDLAMLECTTHRPYPELLSAMPKGDRIKPQKP
jgi:hypothetical protein